jgi:hypothetical protein
MKPKDLGRFLDLETGNIFFPLVSTTGDLRIPRSPNLLNAIELALQLPSF